MHFAWQAPSQRVARMPCCLSNCLASCRRCKMPLSLSPTLIFCLFSVAAANAWSLHTSRPGRERSRTCLHVQVIWASRRDDLQLECQHLLFCPVWQQLPMASIIKYILPGGSREGPPWLQLLAVQHELPAASRRPGPDP